MLTPADFRRKVSAYPPSVDQIVQWFMASTLGRLGGRGE